MAKGILGDSFDMEGLFVYWWWGVSGGGVVNLGSTELDHNHFEN
jgi:hypothetical protein